MLSQSIIWDYVGGLSLSDTNNVVTIIVTQSQPRSSTQTLLQLKFHLMDDPETDTSCEVIFINSLHYFEE